MANPTVRKIIWRVVVPILVAIVPTILLFHFGYTKSSGGGLEASPQSPPSSASRPASEMFSEINLAKPFDVYLQAETLLMEVSGTKIIRLKNGNQVVLAVASTELKNNSAAERLRAERVCRIKALASVVAEKQGVQVCRVEELKEKTVIVLENETEKGKSVSELLQITKTKVEGITKDMPVVGRWKSKEGHVFYLGIGAVIDKNGSIVPQDEGVK